MAKKKKKKRKLLELLNPKNLRKQIDSYGYSFSMGRYALFLMLAISGAAACGIFFSLRGTGILAIALTGLFCMPGLILDGYKNMYEHKRFLDLSDYMEQILYSFQANQKILAALKDTGGLFPSGKMHDAIGKAIAYIEAGECEKDLYQEALEQMEAEYPNRQIHSIHEYIRTVEKNGGEYQDTIDLLLKDKGIWADNVLLLQNEKKEARKKVLFAEIITVVVAMMFHWIYRSMPPEYGIVDHLVVQTATALFLILDILICRRANKEIAKSWIEREEPQDEQRILRHFKTVTEYDDKSERKKSIYWAAPFFIAVLPLFALGKEYAAVISGVFGILMLNQHKMGYRVAYDKVVEEINLVFPQWLMELALLLQTNNVQVSISKTLDTAPAILRPELEEMVRKLKEKPNSAEPYMEFLSQFELSSVQTAMKMLYSISEAGSGDAQSQIHVLAERNSKLLDQSEKMQNEKSLAGLNGMFYLPQVTVSFEMLVNMAVFMLSFLANTTL